MCSNPSNFYRAPCLLLYQRALVVFVYRAAPMLPQKPGRNKQKYLRRKIKKHCCGFKSSHFCCSCVACLAYLSKLFSCFRVLCKCSQNSLNDTLAHVFFPVEQCCGFKSSHFDGFTTCAIPSLIDAL